MKKMIRDIKVMTKIEKSKMTKIKKIEIITEVIEITTGEIKKEINVEIEKETRKIERGTEMKRIIKIIRERIVIKMTVKII